MANKEVKMNKRQKKKHAVDIEALKLFQNMRDWTIEYRSKKERQMLFMICRRAVIDKFPLDEFFIFEIPLQDKDFWVFVFFGLEYNRENPSANEFRQIDFWIYSSKKHPNKFIVSPAALEEEKKNCFEAVYYD